MERPVIGSSGYGRFLTSHYNPGSYISFLNSLSQKLGSKSEKKRIQKELKKREEERKAMQQIDDVEIKEDKEPDIECKLNEVEDNQKLVDTLLEQANLDNIEANVARIIYSLTPGKEVYKSEKFCKFFVSPKVYPLSPVIIFVKMSF